MTILTVNTEIHSTVAFSEQFTARLILHRLCQKAAGRRPVTIDNNHDSRFLTFQRRGGGIHVTDGERCNCIAGQRGRQCWAVKVIQAFGGIERVRFAERLD